MPILQEIVFEPSLNGIYRLGVAPENAPVDLVPVLDGQGLKDKAALLAAIGRALDFPDYYAGNWDALEECLNDLTWRTGPVWLLIRNAGEIPAELMTLLLDILGEAACSWARLGRVFSVFLTGLARPDLPEAF